MKAKKRTVRFYEPILKTPEGDVKYLPDTFWKSFLQYASTLDQAQRDIPYRGRTYLGVSNFHSTTGSTTCTSANGVQRVTTRTTSTTTVTLYPSR